MPFLSLPFLVFLPVFFLLYWYVFGGSLKAQNWLVLAGSYVFYGWWDWRFLFLLIGSSLLNFWLGIALGRTKRYERLLMESGWYKGLAVFYILNISIPCSRWGSASIPSKRSVICWISGGGRSGRSGIGWSSFRMSPFFPVCCRGRSTGRAFCCRN